MQRKRRDKSKKAGGEQTTSIATCGLITAATIFNGVLARGNIDRALVQMPAWRKVGHGLGQRTADTQIWKIGSTCIQ